MNISYQTWVWPFENVEDLIKAMRIVTRYDLIDILTCRLVNKLVSRPVTLENLNSFLATAKSYPHMYPIELVRNIERFDEKVISETNKCDMPSREFIYNSTVCSNCRISLTV